MEHTSIFALICKSDNKGDDYIFRKNKKSSVGIPENVDSFLVMLCWDIQLKDEIKNISAEYVILEKTPFYNFDRVEF